MDLFEQNKPHSSPTFEEQPLAEKPVSDRASQELQRLSERRKAAVESSERSDANWLKVRARDRAISGLVNNGRIDTQEIKESIEEAASQLFQENSSLSEELMAIAVDVAAGLSVPRLDGQRNYDKSDIPTLILRAQVSDELAEGLKSTIDDDGSLQDLASSIIPEIEVDALKEAIQILHDQKGSDAQRVEFMKNSLSKKEAELMSIKAENEDLHVELWENEFKYPAAAESIGELAVEAAKRSLSS